MSVEASIALRGFGMMTTECAAERSGSVTSAAAAIIVRAIAPLCVCGALLLLRAAAACMLRCMLHGGLELAAICMLLCTHRAARAHA